MSRPPLRARMPDEEGFVERDGVRIHYEVHGRGEPAILILPTWSVLDAMHGRFQYADLARHYRVVTFDGRGNGRSDRPRGTAAYSGRQFVDDALAVLDATATRAAVVIGCSLATHWLLQLAAEHPQRVIGAIASGTNLPLAPGHPVDAEDVPFHEPYRSTEGWAKFNAEYWRHDYEGFLRWFFEQVWTEPHSRKLIEDCVAVGLQTPPEVLIDTVGANPMSEQEARELIARLSCPMLVVHGADDVVTPVARSVALARAAGASLAILEGAGHCSGNRDPVRFNLLVREFVASIMPWQPRTERWARSRARARRVLFVPSGVGLGTVRRDIAIADALRARRPDLEISWLAGAPARQALELAGEQVHPASDELVDETAQAEAVSDDHELPRFEAMRRMDEALLVNFMVFHDVAAQDHFDLVVADDAVQVDHHLHENPELKRQAYAWLTDTLGWLPCGPEDDGDAQATRDANAQLLEQVERYPRIRDRALYLGQVQDLPPVRFGRGLPSLRVWAAAHYEFTGVVTGIDHAELDDRRALRASLGYDTDEVVCVATAGGTAVGEALLRQVIAAAPYVRQLLPRSRVVVVAGPRLDPAALPQADGVEVHGYVADLPRQLAAADVAVVHGGGATTMELVAARRPFVWLPFRGDYEQRLFVAQRLARYRASPALEHATTEPEALARAIAGRVGERVRYRPIDRDGAGRAAEVLATLL